MNWLKALTGNGADASNTPGAAVLAAEEALDNNDRAIAKSVNRIDEDSALNSEEMAWLEWFIDLPEAHKELVEACDHRGIRVTAENFAEILKRFDNGYASGVSS